MTNSARVGIPSFITSCGFSDHKSSRDHLIKNHHGNILHTHVCLPSASSVAGADWFDNAKALIKAHGRKNNRRQMWGSKGRLPQIKAPDYRDWRLATGARLGRSIKYPNRKEPPWWREDSENENKGATPENEVTRQIIF